MMRGSLADAAANAMSKGSPRGSTPTGSTATLEQVVVPTPAPTPASGASGGPAAALAAKLSKLSLPPGAMSKGAGDNGRPIENQGEWAELHCCHCS
jgi:hypothetical protein